VGGRFDRALAELAEQWDLTQLDAPFAESQSGVVVPVQRRDGAQLVLKLAITDRLATEGRALSHWAGLGAVRLEVLDAERRALLVERAVPGFALATMCEKDDARATTIAADIITQLWTAPPPSDDAFPGVESWLDCLGSTPSLAPHLLEASLRARDVATDLFRDAGPTALLHGDLHHHNILSATRAPWLAIDPKGVVGPREIEAAALLRNPRNHLLSQPDLVGLLLTRLDILAERLSTDVRRLAGWAYVFAVAAAVWSVEDGEPDTEAEDWLRCAEALEAAARARGAV
jgi:streptomycin 6-kinase